MTKKALVYLILLAVLMVFGLFGCASAPQETTAPTAPEAPEAPVAEEPQEDYPRKAITLIVPAGPGGGTDVLARAFAANAGEHFQQAVIVKNVPGGAFTIGITEVLQSEPDGYTLALTPSHALAFAPHQLDVEYDIDDVFFFDSVALGAAAISIRGDLGFNNIDELLEYARENPNELQVGVAGIDFEVCAELLRDAGYALESIRFDAGGAVATAIAGGHIDVAITSIAAVQGLHEAGLVKMLMTTVPDLVQIEGVPTIDDHPVVKEIIGSIIDTTLGIIGPKGIPEERIQFIQEVLQKTFEMEGFSRMSQRLGLPPMHIGAEVFEAETREEYRISGEIIERLK